MSIAAASVFEVQTGGNDTNGGGFVTGAAGTDYSLVASKRTGTGTDDSTTNAVAAGTTTITSATANFQASIVGNIIYLQGGTGTLAAGWYQVLTRVNSTTITVDRNVATGTGITMNIGGALASPGRATGVGTNTSNTIWVKAGTYSITSSSSNVSGGVSSFASANMKMFGYQTTRGDVPATNPLFQASGIASVAMLTHGANDVIWKYIDVDGANLTGMQGFSVGRGTMYFCRALNCKNSGFSSTTTTTRYVGCYASGCSTAGFAFNSSGSLLGCVATGNTVPGFSGVGTYAFCIAYANTGATTDGFQHVNQGMHCQNCVSYNNGRDGFRVTTTLFSAINCIAANNASGTGFNSTSTGASCFLFNCATRSNNVATAGIWFGGEINNIPLTADPFTNAGSADFSLNNNNPGGAELYGVGFPGVMPTSGGTGYLDIGALQHQSSGSSGGGLRVVGYGGLAAG